MIAMRAAKLRVSRWHSEKDLVIAIRIDLNDSQIAEDIRVIKYNSDKPFHSCVMLMFTEHYLDL